jgi:DNA adenine methylase
VSAAAEISPDDPVASVALPFLKWVGGKRWLAPALAPLVRAYLTGTYIEPFGGGAALLLHLAPADAVLGDVNAELIETFETVQARPEDVVHAVWRFSNTPECYYRVRAAVPRTAVGRAARFIYLNRTAWGGIYRLNGEGAFNVPFGSTGRRICRKDLIVNAAEALTSTRFTVADFSKTIDSAGAGDVVYADPPYVGRDLGREESFARYHFPPFTWPDQERLARCAHAAVARGATVFVTARGSVGVEGLYPGWQATPLTRKQRVSRRLDRRQLYSETLLFSG